MAGLLKNCVVELDQDLSSLLIECIFLKLLKRFISIMLFDFNFEMLLYFTQL